jgi:hypothetical protein
MIEISGVFRNLFAITHAVWPPTKHENGQSVMVRVKKPLFPKQSGGPNEDEEKERKSCPSSVEEERI